MLIGRRDNTSSAAGKRSFLLPASCSCLLLLLLLSGCRQDMQDQPRYEVYEANPTFSDRAASRPLVEGTIPRGYLREDSLYYTGKMSGGQAAQGAGAQANTNGGTAANATQASAPNTQGGTGGQTAGGGSNVSNNAAGSVAGPQTQAPRSSSSGSAPAGQPQDAAEFPFPITQEVLTRGQERYQIYCSICHGATGYGDGMIVRRGYRRPPSYHDPRLRDAPVGHFFDVITNGWGAMPDYASQIPVQDRWAIIAYVRALQLSQQVPVAEVPADKLKQAQTSNGHQEGGGEHH